MIFRHIFNNFLVKTWSHNGDWFSIAQYSEGLSYNYFASCHPLHHKIISNDSLFENSSEAENNSKEAKKGYLKRTHSCLHNCRDIPFRYPVHDSNLDVIDEVTMSVSKLLLFWWNTLMNFLSQCRRTSLCSSFIISKGTPLKLEWTVNLWNLKHQLHVIQGYGFTASWCRFIHYEKWWKDLLFWSLINEQELVLSAIE